MKLQGISSRDEQKKKKSRQQTPKRFASSFFGLPGKPPLPVWCGRSHGNRRLVLFSRPAIEEETETSSISWRKSVCLANLTSAASATRWCSKKAYLHHCEDGSTDGYTHARVLKIEKGS